ncbi:MULTISPECIES: MarR family transcriptional regulator [Comamonas]|nr:MULTISPECIES: MarR family transcriptional regulator [Comamonas]MPS93646.1 MarR family transcriptional regulator [Comamonas sp.]
MPRTEPLSSRQRQLMFVMAQVNKQWRRTLDKVLAPLGLTQALWLPLVHLERSEGTMRQKDLAQALALDSSSLVRLIDGLQAQGWVERLDDADRRVKRLQLTTAGLAQVEQVQSIVSDVRREVMQELAPELLDAMLEALATMQEKMADLETGASPCFTPGR